MTTPKQEPEGDEKRPGFFSQFRAVLANDELPVFTRLLFGVTFIFGLLWSLKIALTNLLWG